MPAGSASEGEDTTRTSGEAGSSDPESDGEGRGGALVGIIIHCKLLTSLTRGTFTILGGTESEGIGMVGAWVAPVRTPLFRIVNVSLAPIILIIVHTWG